MFLFVGQDLPPGLQNISHCISYVHGFVQDLQSEELGIGVTRLLEDLVHDEPGVWHCFELVQNVVGHHTLYRSSAQATLRRYGFRCT